MHIEIYEQNSYNVVTGYAIYSIKTFKNGWSEYGYIVTYNVSVSYTHLRAHETPEHLL